MDRGGPCKRKRLEPIVESPIILGQSSPYEYHLTEYDYQQKCSKEICATTQGSSIPYQNIRRVRQQVTANAHTDPVQPARTAHSAPLDATSELSKASCENGYPGNVTAGQVCFGMVRNVQRLPPFASRMVTLPYAGVVES